MSLINKTHVKEYPNFPCSRYKITGDIEWLAIMNLKVAKQEGLQEALFNYALALSIIINNNKKCYYQHVTQKGFVQ